MLVVYSRMALLPVFPLQRPISFLPQGKASQIGKLPELETISCNLYTRVQLPIWEKIAEARLRIAEAKMKFSEMNARDLKGKWSKLDDATIERYRLQFRVIDLNEDGLIDFKELCQVLDEMGDTSSEEERRVHFQSVDVDQSDGVDFEEFLELLERVQSGGFAEGGFTKMCTSTDSAVKDIMQIGQLSLQQLIRFELY